MAGNDAAGDTQDGGGLRGVAQRGGAGERDLDEHAFREHAGADGDELLRRSASDCSAWTSRFRKTCSNWPSEPSTPSDSRVVRSRTRMPEAFQSPSRNSSMRRNRAPTWTARAAPGRLTHRTPGGLTIPAALAASAAMAARSRPAPGRLLAEGAVGQNPGWIRAGCGAHPPHR